MSRLRFQVKEQEEVTVGRYGRAAVRATGFFHDRLVDSPQEAWEQATTEQFPDSTSSQEKGCPRGAFLGLWPRMSEAVTSGNVAIVHTYSDTCERQ
jgi:hypothetical protein